MKTPEEIRRLSEAARRNEAAEMLDALHAARAGGSFTEVVENYERSSIRNGSTPRYWVGGAGRRSAVQFPGSDYAIVAGDVIRIDCGGTYENYCSDTGHTACVGEPDSELAAAFAAMREGIEAGIAMAGPGVRASALYDTVVSTLRRGLPRHTPANVGHALGLEQYDSVTFGPDSAYVLEEDLVFNIEAPYYELGWAGIQLEQTFRVTAHGIEALTLRPNDLIIV